MVASPVCRERLPLPTSKAGMLPGRKPAGATTWWVRASQQCATSFLVQRSGIQIPTLVAVLAMVPVACSKSRSQAPEAPTVTAPANPSARPRLLVLCSVDQLATWVWNNGRPFFRATGGFQRLLRDGVHLPQCAYLHACTETGPGHATLGTGAPANVHGIVKNQWFVPENGKKIYCVEQEMAALPDLPEGKNRGPGLLRVPTLGDALKAQVPGSKVVSVSWKDRSAILMGGRSADVCAWLENTTGRLVTNTAWVTATPPWITAFNREGTVDKFFGWTWDRFGPEAAYAGLVDDRLFEVPHQNGSNQKTLPQPLTGGKPDPDTAFYAQVYNSPIGNEVVLLAAQAAITGHELGHDDVPDLLCVSFSATDVIGHGFGPESVESRDALLRLDDQLGRLLAFLDEHVGAGQWAFLLSADHGVGPTPEAAKEQGLDAGRGVLQTRARAAAEQALVQAFGDRKGDQPYIQQASEFSFFLEPAALEAHRGERSLAEMTVAASRVAATAAVKAPGILAAWATADILADGKDQAEPLRRALFYAIHPGRAGEVQLVIKPYWLDGVTPASHGTPHPYDREVVGLALGPGLARGVSLAAPVSPGVFASIGARLLAISPPPAATEVVPDGVFAPK
ncbi:MAG: alkaline phosphatase family protein [Planctomycetes bacterium]|nr:alkaline phosphatase family protein [Planctomycetota bacterium]